MAAWNYAIALRDTGVFDEIAKARGVAFPEDLRTFIIDKNAAQPKVYCYALNEEEKVFGAVLSFNRHETEADSVFPALSAVRARHEIPFAIDPFGNYLCYNTTSGIVDFWNHETDVAVNTGRTLSAFIQSLY